MLIKKIFIFIIGILFFGTSFGEYYEANSDIDSYLKDLTNSFQQIKSYSELGNSVPSKYFQNIANDFSVLKNKLPQDNPSFKIIYEKCEISANDLVLGFSKDKLNTFNAQCFGPWKSISRRIFTEYQVRAKIKASPKFGSSPLTVTFDGRNSKDPSNRTIPTNNYYWYYTNSKGQRIFMGQGSLIKYTFTEPNDYIVHLTVRSANKTINGILDGSAITTISVNPAIAKINLFINGIKASDSDYVKVSSQEGKQGVLFDASGTTPNGVTKIVSSTWIIKNNNKVIFTKTIPDFPGSVRVKLNQKGFYFITLKIKDNTGKSISKKFKLIVSNPVSLIKISPKIGNTSTKVKIDGGASYSVNGNIEKYSWTIVGPNGNKIDSFQGKTSFNYKFRQPGYYSIKLEVEDVNGNKNNTTYKLQILSTPPVANFIYKKYDNWEKPSTFIFDASLSSDVDIDNGDKLTYNWNISNSNNVKIQKINNGKKIIVQFNKKGKYNITLIVKDKYGKTSSISKSINVKSTLRPEITLNPNYTVLGNSIGIKIKTNKPTLYYYYNYGDGESSKTQSSFMEHIYKKAGIYTLKVEVSSSDGDTNSITKNVFIGQRGYPLAIYKIYNKDNEKLASTFCKIKKENGTGCVFVQAYSIPRQSNFIIDGNSSVNGKGEKKLLKIYFKKTDTDEYINKSKLNIKFEELGCKKIELYVKDLITNKLDKKVIYFKVKNALPVLNALNMYFPQYGGNQGGAFKPNIGNNQVPVDIFKAGIDPLLVKLIAVGGRDLDSPILSHYRWYYYKKGDKTNLKQVKITPYNISQVIFSLPKIPGTYIFNVDVCDVDGDCTSANDFLHSKPIINIPPSLSNPDIPQVNSVRIDLGQEKGVGEVNVGDKIDIVVNSDVLSNKSDFKLNRTIKYDFDNDGKWDLTTKKTKVSYIFKKPGKYKIKVKVIYRGYGGIGYSSDLIVKKGLKPLVDIVNHGNYLLFNDLSFGNIKEKKLCFNIKKCRKNKSFVETEKEYGNIIYSSTGTKLMLFKFHDNYGNSKTLKKRIRINKLVGKKSFLLTLPQNSKNGKNYKIIVTGMYKDNIILYYYSKNKNCSIDQNILVDSDKDGNVSNDKDLLCNKVYNLTYNLGLQNITLLVNDGGVKHKLDLDLVNIQNKIPSKYENQYKIIQTLIYKYSTSDSDDIKNLVKVLSDLLNNIDDNIERPSILLNLDGLLKNGVEGIEKEDLAKIKSLISSLSDIATNAALNNGDKIEQVKEDLLFLLGDKEKEINDLFKKLGNTTDKNKRKKILQDILNIGLEEQKNGNIDLETLQSVKSDICELLKYYEIPSKACGTELKENVKVESASTTGKIFKIVGIVFGVILFIFIVIVGIFVIKAKRTREEQEED